MTATQTLHAIAADVVGHYGRAAKSVVAAYRTSAERALAATGVRYEQLVDRKGLLPLSDERKARIKAAERRLAGVVGQGVARFTRGANEVVDGVSARATKGVEAFAQQTEWAKDLMLVKALRRINLPTARLSLEIASRVDGAAQRLNARVAGPRTAQAVKPARRKSTAKRVRRNHRAA